MLRRHLQGSFEAHRNGTALNMKALLAARHQPRRSSRMTWLPMRVLAGLLLSTNAPTGEGAPVPCQPTNPIQDVKPATPPFLLSTMASPPGVWTLAWNQP